MSRKAFTLLELIVVVVIIGVIAGFAIPGYQKAIEKGEERTAIIKLKGIMAGMKILKQNMAAIRPSTCSM